MWVIGLTDSVGGGIGIGMFWLAGLGAGGVQWLFCLGLEALMFGEEFGLEELGLGKVNLRRKIRREVNLHTDMSHARTGPTKPWGGQHE